MEIVHFIVDTGSGTGPSSGTISCLSVLGPTGTCYLYQALQTRLPCIY